MVWIEHSHFSDGEGKGILKENQKDGKGKRNKTWRNRHHGDHETFFFFFKKEERLTKPNAVKKKKRVK